MAAAVRSAWRAGGFDGVLLAGLARAALAWRNVAGMFPAADHGVSLLPQSAPVLRGVELSIWRRERILLEGASGGGKSTMAALLTGLQKPESGLLLPNGLDRSALGDRWHELATEAPQFHENHVLNGALGFNLLVGRNWPASDDELQEATDLCKGLGWANCSNACRPG